MDGAELWSAVFRNNEGGVEEYEHVDIDASHSFRTTPRAEDPLLQLSRWDPLPTTRNRYGFDCSGHGAAILQLPGGQMTEANAPASGGSICFLSGARRCVLAPPPST